MEGRAGAPGLHFESGGVGLGSFFRQGEAPPDPGGGGQGGGGGLALRQHPAGEDEKKMKNVYFHQAGEDEKKMKIVYFHQAGEDEKKKNEKCLFSSGR